MWYGQILDQAFEYVKKNLLKNIYWGVYLNFVQPSSGTIFPAVYLHHHKFAEGIVTAEVHHCHDYCFWDHILFNVIQQKVEYQWVSP